MNNRIKSQRGMTMISMAVVVIFILFQVVIAMNVIPVYLTDNTVKDVMAGLTTDAAAASTPTSKLKTLVAKRLSINSVYSIKTDQIKVKKGRGESIVTIEYEPRGKLIGSLEYIVSFKHETRIPSR